MGASRFDFESAREQLARIAGCPVNVQQVNPIRQKSMLRWSAPSFQEYEERAAVFEFLGNAKRIHANNDAFEYIHNLLRERDRPLMRLPGDLQKRLLNFFARVSARLHPSNNVADLKFHVCQTVPKENPGPSTIALTMLCRWSVPLEIHIPKYRPRVGPVVPCSASTWRMAR